NQRLLQPLQGAKKGLGVAVLGLEIRPDIGIEQGGIAQYVLPLGILQPGVVVDKRCAVEGALRRPPRCCWWRRSIQFGGGALRIHWARTFRPAGSTGRRGLTGGGNVAPTGMRSTLTALPARTTVIDCRCASGVVAARRRAAVGLALR